VFRLVLEIGCNPVREERKHKMDINETAELFAANKKAGKEETSRLLREAEILDTRFASLRDEINEQLTAQADVLNHDERVGHVLVVVVKEDETRVSHKERTAVVSVKFNKHAHKVRFKYDGAIKLDLNVEVLLNGWTPYLMYSERKEEPQPLGENHVDWLADRAIKALAVA
jgi:hypothetical protein